MSTSPFQCPEIIQKAIDIYGAQLRTNIDNRWYILRFESYSMMFQWVNSHDQWASTMLHDGGTKKMSQDVTVTVDTNPQLKL